MPTKDKRERERDVEQFSLSSSYTAKWITSSSALVEVGEKDMPQVLFSDQLHGMSGSLESYIFLVQGEVKQKTPSGR